MVSTKTALTTLGWRVDNATRLREGIEDFQRGWNLGPALKVDGDDGPLTKAALATSLARKGLGRPDFSANFSAVEFRCACGGKDQTCRRIWAYRALVRAAEEYRERVGPLRIDRGCRCPTANRAVGGKSNSQHLHGTAIDVTVFRISVAKVRAMGVVSGIGTYTYNGVGYPRHIDVRHIFGTSDRRNSTDSTIANPAQWVYGPAKYPPITPRPPSATPPPAVKPPAAPAPAPVPPPTPEEIDDMVLIKRKDRPEVYKTDGFRRIHINQVERDALLAAGFRLIDDYTTDEQLAAFGPLEPSDTP